MNYDQDIRTARGRVYLGTTESGKTYLFCKHLDEEDKVIVFDPTGDEKLEKFGIHVATAKDLVALIRQPTKTGKFRIRLTTDNPELFDFACRVAMEVGDLTLAIDEGSSYCNPSWMPKYFKDVVRLGRHAGPTGHGRVKYMITSQRMPDLNPLILSQAKGWYLFQMHLPRDIEYLKKFVPDIEQCIDLKQGECLIWKPGMRSLQATNGTTLVKSASALPTETLETEADSKPTEPADSPTPNGTPSS